jgi:hypothetical protein
MKRSGIYGQAEGDRLAGQNGQIHGEKDLPSTWRETSGNNPVDIVLHCVRNEPIPCTGTCGKKSLKDKEQRSSVLIAGENEAERKPAIELEQQNLPLKTAG